MREDAALIVAMRDALPALLRVAREAGRALETGKYNELVSALVALNETGAGE